jgi:hypothetical protein
MIGILCGVGALVVGAVLVQRFTRRDVTEGANPALQKYGAAGDGTGYVSMDNMPKNDNL